MSAFFPGDTTCGNTTVITGLKLSDPAVGTISYDETNNQV